MLEYILSNNTDLLIKDIIVRTVITLLSWMMIFASCLVDLWTAVSVVKAGKKKPTSHGFRKTITKVSDYFKVALVGLMFDLLGSIFSWYGIPYMTLLVTIAVLGIEGKSVIENLKRKKSTAANIPIMIEMIQNAKDEKSAGKAMKVLSNWFNGLEKNSKWQGSVIEEEIEES